jgi:ubiquinone/menaquinone biosynthesis C-methylase UbiE
MTELTRYLDMLTRAYKEGTNNHPEHNYNPLYWDILLGELKYNPTRWLGKVALDFGCGQGRNITNMKKLAPFARVDGVDISAVNIAACQRHESNNSNFYVNNGKDLQMLPDDEYDFIMSTIVFQHLCAYDLRYNLKKEIYRVMKSSAIFSFQMGYGDMNYKGHGQVSGYYENSYAALHTNGGNDVRVSDPAQLETDLFNIGFKNISYKIEPSYSDGGHPSWIYVQCEK